jgi:abequosyltransferase
MSIKLSICIPTYNRGAYLGETLESIISQATDEVEIVVSDNASSDNTKDIIRKYSAIFPRLVYIREEVNHGADANYMNVVAHASGEYCWLFGSDDAMREGSLKDILAVLKIGPAVLLSNRMECDINLRPFQIREWLVVSESQIAYDFSTDNDVAQYFESVKSLGGVFSYLSSIVVKRELWNAIPMDNQFMGSAYSHVYKILSVLLQGGRLLFYNDWTVYCRIGNDSFSENGYLRRVLLDINGYTALASVLLADKPEAKQSLLKVLQRQENNLFTLVRIVNAASSEGIWPDVKERLVKMGIDNSLILKAEYISQQWWFKPIIGCMEHLRASQSLKKIITKVRLFFLRLRGIRHV